MERFTFKIRHLLLLTMGIALSISAWVAIQESLSTRTIAAIDLPQNKRFRLIQTSGGEPFDTKIYFDSGDGQWGFYYYEHEDWYWNDATLKSDEETLTVFRKGKPTIRLNTKTGFCVVRRSDGWEREYDAPTYYTSTLPGSTDP
jgi:signal peptidase I